MANLNLTPTKTEMIWRADGSIRVIAAMVDAQGGARFAATIIIDASGGVFNADGGLQIGTLTAGQLTSLQNVGARIDNLIAAADAAGKLVF